mmetsp:Transcript_9216/g.11620  ORF Transcript_9216/g.11620 Transcript_9216/m.11620 type:complete len:145 (+) Transcript_9216:68-502(+)
MRSILDAARGFNERHERLKNYVHTAWRVPLPRWGQVLMGCFYFSVPVVGGWHVMQWAISKAHDSIGEKGEKLKIKDVQGIGDSKKMDGEMKRIGAGGVGMGVRLAVSDQDDQDRSKKMLEKMLNRARKRKIKEEKLKNSIKEDP